MQASAPRTKIFHGWWMVWGCMLVAIVAWSFALYGPSVYLYTLSTMHGWPIGVISSALTLSFLVNATVLGFVGTAIAKFGPGRVMASGACIMACGLTLIGQTREIWQVFAAFSLMGLGWSCLSTTAITSSLAPWFERFQGRAVSTALLGASIGGMVGVPFLLLMIHYFGFSSAMLCVGLILLATVLPISTLVMKHRPQDLGLTPDGLPIDPKNSTAITRRWSRFEALRSLKLQTIMLAFGLALLVQIGFLTHQVSLLRALLDDYATAYCVTGAAMLAFAGRLILARFADRLDVRVIACAVLVQAGAATALAALLPSEPWAVITAVLMYGMTAGNTTTLPPIIVRREFGAISFGVVFGVCATLMQVMSAMGPAFFGLLRDLSGSYQLPLALAAAMNFAAAIIVMAGRKESSPTRASSPE